MRSCLTRLDMFRGPAPGLEGGSGYCYAAYSRLALELGVSQHKIRRSNARLRGARLATRERKLLPLLELVGKDVYSHSMHYVPFCEWGDDEEFLMIPRWLLARWDVTPIAKLVWAVLRDDAQPKRYGERNPLPGHACLRRGVIGNRLRCSIDVVGDALRLLREVDLIEPAGLSGDGRAYYRLLEHPWRRYHIDALRDRDRFRPGGDSQRF